MDPMGDGGPGRRDVPEGKSPSMAQQPHASYPPNSLGPSPCPCPPTPSVLFLACWCLFPPSAVRRGAARCCLPHTCLCKAAPHRGRLLASVPATILWM